MTEALIAQEKQNFIKYFGAKEPRLFKCPGRVNIIGEHLDYNGGMVLPAAISLGIYAWVRFRSDKEVHIRSNHKEQEIIFSLQESIEFRAEDDWGNYPKGVVAAMREKFPIEQGADILYFSTLPEGSGLSSSAALEVLTAFIFHPKQQTREILTEPERVEISLLCQEVENKFIGVQCGIMDQFSVAMGKKDHAILLNTSNLEYKYIPLHLGSQRIVILNSKKPRTLAGSEFNKRRQESTQALEYIQQTHPQFHNLAQCELRHLALIPDLTIQKRARHVISENQRVKRTMEALSADDKAKFAYLLTESHTSLHEDYEVTGHELHSLVQGALVAPGCYGARMTGAGFGGCALALIDADKYTDFSRETLSYYLKQSNFQGESYQVEIEDGVREII